MQAKKRYLLLFVSCAFLAYCYFGGYRLKSSLLSAPYVGLPVFAEPEELCESPEPGPGAVGPRVSGANRPCRMDTCFDFSKCRSEFKVYVYPHEAPESLGPVPPVSPSYLKVLSVIRESRYYTNDPAKACLFVLAIDTLDRDKLSVDFVRNVQARLHQLPQWNGGRNHLIFNLYSGTWPDYSEEHLGFDAGMAILAQASMSATHFRHGFDISLPLFHKQHPERGGAPGTVLSNNFPVNKKYLLAFKGKRYVHGIGSETRNSLWHLHNERDLVMVTTCRHGKSWRDMKDDRCDEDNAEYDRGFTMPKEIIKKRMADENNLVGMVNVTNDGDSDPDEEESEPVEFTAKVTSEGVELGRKLGDHFLQNDQNVERAPISAI